MNFKKILKLLLVLILIVGVALASFTFGKGFSDNDDNSDNTNENSGVRYLNTLVTDGTNLAVNSLNSDGSYSAIEKDVSIFGSDVVWTPGHKETVTLNIANNGNDTVRYSLGVNSAEETAAVDALGKEVKLSETLQFGFANSLSDTYEIPTSKALNSGYGMVGTLEKGCSQTLVLVVYLPETAENIFAKADISLGITLLASQPMNGDVSNESISGVAGFNASANLEGVVENGSLSAPVAIGGSESSMSAVVPSGVKLEDGASQLTLSVNNVDNSAANITLGQNDSQHSLDIHVSGVAEDNDIPMEIMLRGVASAGLNSTSIKLYHVENGQTIEMLSLAATEPFSAHNQFKYDPITGNITIYIASFSEIAVVADIDNAWKGNFDYDWYDADKSELVIANAEQLAGFSAIVGGMANGIEIDSFAGKTVTLIADINIGDTNDYYDDASENGIVFYPIGYYNDAKSYDKPVNASATAASVSSFEGIFDGHGHTIANFYHNTWEMWGNYDGNYYKVAMGLFGYVHGGTVKNLTVKNYSSDGEFTPTGVIAAYADGNSVFENIAIVDCNPRVYNTGNGGIIGIAGDTRGINDDHMILRNITVENSNKITALWGSWDVACGGLVGMYRGNVDNSGNATGDTIHFDNCHVSAQIDVYNDVCANYQYYAYRYSGMIIGSVRHNKTENGHSYPDMTGISANGCTVHLGDWNDYYYCELVANSLASYTHDHQMSRLTQVEKVDVDAKKYLPLGSEDIEANWIAIPSGRVNYVVVKAKGSDDMWIHGDGHNFAECYHFVNGVQHLHDVADADNPNPTETVDGVEGVLKEDKQLIYREFNNLFTGYGWGVTSKGVIDFEGVIGMDISETDKDHSLEKFEKVEDAETTFKTGTTINVGDLFKDAELGITINKNNVQITVYPANDHSTVVGVYTPNTEDWTQGTITLTGAGAAKVVINDYYFCIATEIDITVEYDAGKGGVSDKTNELILKYGDWGVVTSGSPSNANGAPEGAIEGLDNIGGYVTYTFCLKEAGTVDFIWNVAGSNWQSGQANLGINDLSKYATIKIDGNPVNIKDIDLYRGVVGTQTEWWNLQDVTILGVELESGVHTFEFELFAAYPEFKTGVNVGLMTIKSTSDIGVKGATYQSADIVTDNGKIYYDIKLKTTKFLETSDVVFKNLIDGVTYPVVSITVDEDGNGVVRVDITEAARAENNFASFKPEIYILDSKTTTIPNYVKLVDTTLVTNEDNKRVYYRLTYRIFGYDTNGIAIVDGNKESYGAIVNKQDGFIVTCDIDITGEHELEIWPHLQIGAGLYWDDKNSVLNSNNNGDVHVNEGFDPDEFYYEGYTYMLHEGYDMPVAFVIYGEKYIKLNNAYLSQKDSRVYYDISYRVVGYGKTSEVIKEKIKIVDGNTDFGAVPILDDAHYVTFRIDVTDFANDAEIWPHLWVEKNHWDGITNTESSNGDIKIVGGIDFKDDSVELNGRRYLMKKTYDMPAVLVIPTTGNYVKVVGADLFTGANGTNALYTLTFDFYGYDTSKFEFFDNTTVYSYENRDQNGFRVTFRFNINQHSAIYPHLRIDGKNFDGSKGDIILSVTTKTITLKNGKKYTLATMWNMPVVTSS